jgi:hypothetical protein
VPERAIESSASTDRPLRLSRSATVDALELRVRPFEHFEPTIAELPDLEARIGPHRLGSLKRLAPAAARFEAMSEAVVDGQHPSLSACPHAS